MKIELKRITYNARLSQETAAYAADVWVDGVKRGTVSNDGHGGPDMVWPHTLQQEIETYAKTLPPRPCKMLGGFLPQDAESIFAGLLDRHLATKNLQKKLKTHVLFTTAGSEDIWQIKGKVPPKDAVKVLNNLPIEEAIEIYLKASQP